MADYQLRIGGPEEAIPAVQTPNEREGQCEALALFAFPDTMRGQLALEADGGNADGKPRVS